MKRDIKINTIVEIISKMVGFLFTVIISRLFGAQSLGIVTSTQAIVGYIYLLGDFGTNTEAVRRISKNNNKAHKVYSIVSTIRLVIMFLVVALILIIFQLTNDWIFLLLSIVSIITLLIPNYLFMGLMLFRYNAYVNLITMISTLVCFFILLNFYYSVIIYPVSLLIGSILGLVVSYVFVFRSIGRPKFVSCKIELGDFYKKTIYLGMTVVFARIYYDFDIILLRYMRTSLEVGLYSAAFKVIQVLWFIPALYTTYALPYTTKLIHDNRQSVSSYINKALRYIIIFISITGVIGIFYSSEILVFLYGNSFSSASLAFVVLLIGYCLMFIKTLFGNLLVALRDERYLFILSVIGSIFNIVLNIFLIPYLGILGAAFATLLTEFILLSLEFRRVKKNFICRLPWVTIIKTFVAAGVLIILLTIYKPYLFFGVFISILIYIILLFLLKEEAITSHILNKIIINKEV
ncbi:flippase [Bacillus alveayuensis]|uniref:flippase n=1 Tax=Aeribacillus alveayuensis TaxID=279215 RepID=UPI0005CD936A|nr:flippase [Bacillus alveayuensis]